MAQKFNPPPSWPAAPEGWVPPEGWQPDPEWGPLPDGWQLWTSDDGDRGTAPSGLPAPAAAPVAQAPRAAEPKPDRLAAARSWIVQHKALSVVGGVLVLGLIGSAASGTGGSKPDVTATAPSASATTSASASATASTKSTPTASAVATPSAVAKPMPSVPPAPVIPPAVEYSGVGDSILNITKPGGADVAAIATITHQGGSNFAVWSLDAAMAHNDLLVNEIGNYTGTVLMDKSSRKKSISLEITADGPWTVKIGAVQSALHWDGSAPASGVGDNVLFYTGKAGAAAVTHDGSSNFAVWAYATRGDLLINEIGPYTGTVRWMAGPALYEINADGRWTVALK